jgi:hypothetical protein
MIKKMKKVFLSALVALVMVSGTVMAQEQPVPQKDTVNMDTDAKPTFYYDVEDEESLDTASGKSASGVIAIVVGAVIVVGAAAFLLLRKKK